MNPEDASNLQEYLFVNWTQSNTKRMELVKAIQAILRIALSAESQLKEPVSEIGRHNALVCLRTIIHKTEEAYKENR
jgi:hypothetical protein